MAAGSEIRRVDLGFVGGGVLQLRLRDTEYGAFKKALESGKDDWHAVKAEDSEVSINLGQVVYLRLEGERDHVGF